MFVSFFPRPRAFFVSAAVWVVLAVLLWQFAAKGWGAFIGLPPAVKDAPPIIGIAYFWSKPFLWFDVYFWAMTAIFAGAWWLIARHPWQRWSVWGTALIIFATYLQVQVSVLINAWYVPFYDRVQAALSHTRVVTAGELFGQILIFTEIAMVAIAALAVINFFTSHYIFRWRTAMNDYFMANWTRLRVIEGAAQRIQEDTMRFSSTVEDMGGSLVNSAMTLIAFLPVLMMLSAKITSLPFVGQVPAPLVTAALFWAAFGTALLAIAGVRLPGLQFHIQRVEAAYRKELVYGEDDPARARPPTTAELFGHVRRLYFRYYFNFLYFNIFRYLYVQADLIFPTVILIPTIAAGAITFGLYQQILNAFSQVSGSFQYLVNSWTTIVELQSIYKRLRGFEASIHGQPMDRLEAGADA